METQKLENGMSAQEITGTTWRKSRRSNAGGNCVEVTTLSNGDIALRNSRFPAGPALLYTQEEAAAFLLGVKDGDFDFALPASPTDH